MLTNTELPNNGKQIDGTLSAEPANKTKQMLGITLSAQLSNVKRTEKV